MSTSIEMKANDQSSLMRDGIIRARINRGLKREVEQVLNHLGLTMSEAIHLYLVQIKLTKGIPFEIKIPNQVTLRTFKKTDKGHSIVKAKTVREIFEKADC